MSAIPVLETEATLAMELRRAFDAMAIDDTALASPAYQAKVLADVREAAGDGFDELIENLRQWLLEAPWIVIVRGLPVAVATPILVAVSASLGELVEPYRQPWSRVIRHIVPSRDRAIEGRVLNELLHTDGTDWVRPNDYTCLFCVRRPDRAQDGVSRLLDAATLLDELSSEPAARIVSRLADEPMPWRVADELGGGVHWEPPLQLNPPQIRWLRYTITLSHDDGLAKIAEETLSDLAHFEHLVEGCRRTTSLRLDAGDLLLIDNTRSLHARTPIADPLGSTRELLRTKVMRREASR
jgi:hypothetical protein